MKKRMVFLAALALCAGLLCGCGDGSPASGTESTPAETSLPESQASLAGEPGRRGERAGGVPAIPGGFLRGQRCTGGPEHLRLDSFNR